MDFQTGDQNPQRRVETPNVNVPPPPRRESTVWRGTKLAFGGCVVMPVLLLLGFVGCFAVLGTGGEGGSQSGGGEAKKQQAVAVGEPATVGNVVWVVNDAKKATRLTSRFERPIQGNFVIVNFSFTNDGNEATTLDSGSLTLVDSEGRKSEADPDKFGYIPPKMDIFLENINPGVTRDGQVIFTVAPDASGFKLRAGDTEIFSESNARIDLGF